MKSGAGALLLAVWLAAARTAAGADALDGLSPVTRVVELLKDLQKLCEENLDAETTAFEKFKCWATTTVSVKTASNEKAEARLESLEQYIADLEAGRIELTSERSDLEKEIAGLTADLENAEALRDREHEDFLAAEEETKKAIAAVEEAVGVLEEAQPGGGSFLTVDRKAGAGRLRSGAADFDKLMRAVDFGKRFLSRGDAVFLERVLTGDVPEWDWKKLNRKAEFKMSYTTRTAKIVQVLKNIKFTFAQTLNDMVKKEEAAVETYEKLKESKTGQKDAAEEALGKMELEGAARGQTKSEAQSEVDDLKTQMENDEKFIGQAKAELKEKEDEWVERKKIRMDEISAISEAIRVLHSDDARDLFKRSLSSQGYVQVSSQGFQFVQASQSRARARELLASAPRRASTAVRRAAALAGGDPRLLALAERISEVSAAPAPAPAAAEVVSGKFDEVVALIDKIVELLQEEEKEDLNTKEECETTRMENTRGSVLLAREIDELSDTITSAKAKIAELEAEVEEKAAEVKAIEEELEAATKIRQEETAAHAKTDKDDEDAAATIVQAIEVLEGFYKAQGALLQERRQPSNDYVAAAGAAPPPPPATWENPAYTGRDKESSGILAILTMIKEDIDKDRVKAQKAEDDAQKHYDEFSGECGTQIGELNGAITELQGTIGEKETEVEEAVGQRSTKKGELTALIQSIKGLQPGCDYMLVNYVVRSANRKIEIDGLEKAKAILKGAAFDESDPNRELVPGDALVQK